MSCLEVRELTFAYRGGPLVVDIEWLHLEAGESLFLEGPSGCGKTTLLSLLAGVLSPARGRIGIGATDLSRLGPAARDRFRGAAMGYLFQTFNLLPYLDLVANVALPCQLHAERRQRLGEQSPREAALEWLERLDLAAFGRRLPGELSVGQQQRAALARALIGQPRLVLADEPCSALDPQRRPRFLKLLLETCREHGATLIVVSHDQESAGLFDRRLGLQSLNRVAAELST